MIQIDKTHINDCFVIKYNQFQDHRGHFSELYKASELSLFKPIQSNYSFSKKNVLRGIHRTPYAKLVSCIHGAVFDVCVDLREDSSTYLQYYSIELNPEYHNSIYIPPYCGHGFLALKDGIVIYYQDQEYNQLTDETYCYKNFNIKWPSINHESISISSKDIGSCNEKY
jgi:dTDP-4-dehydrorhamnose 3,5-epimerase